MIRLPKRIFFTGVPGSRWSGVAQILERNLNLNISDRNPEREYNHTNYTGHRGAYFGKGMEHDAKLDLDYLESAWKEPNGTKLIKSHEWAYQLPEIKKLFPDDWIIMVYRPDIASYAWWHEAGGFNITYPDYSEYKDSYNMYGIIIEQNKLIMNFSYEQKSVWHHFAPEFFRQEFNISVTDIQLIFKDCLITVIR